MLALIAWGAVEIYGEVIKSPMTDQSAPQAPAAGQKPMQGG
ncbi:hypothetical protein [Mesorhizobium sp. M1E.F.Ca.ET.041.01.1.1]